jgi:hypothetical protein
MSARSWDSDVVLQGRSDTRAGGFAAVNIYRTGIKPSLGIDEKAFILKRKLKG